MKTLLLLSLVVVSVSCASKARFQQDRSDRAAHVRWLGHLQPEPSYVPRITRAEEERRLEYTLDKLRSNSSDTLPMCASYDRYHRARDLHEKVLENPVQLVVNLNTSIEETNAFVQRAYYAYALAFLSFARDTWLMQQHEARHCLSLEGKGWHRKARAQFDLLFGKNIKKKDAHDWLQFTITNEILRIRQQKFEHSMVDPTIVSLLDKRTYEEILRYGKYLVVQWRAGKETGDPQTIREILQIEDMRPVDLRLTPCEAGRILNLGAPRIEDRETKDE